MQTETARLLRRRMERDAIVGDRRNGYDRRTLTARSFLRGGLNPRRRGGRRATDQGFLVDWHEPHLLFLCTSILLLSVADAFLTLLLISHGAYEANPVMAYVLDGYPQAFAGVKMAMTGLGLMVLVVMARAKVFRLIRVSSIIHACLLAYVALIGYEWWLLRALL